MRFFGVLFGYLLESLRIFLFIQSEQNIINSNLNKSKDAGQGLKKNKVYSTKNRGMQLCCSLFWSIFESYLFTFEHAFVFSVFLVFIVHLYTSLFQKLICKNG